jgi:predicted protein tyrosine phosphatase
MSDKYLMNRLGNCKNSYQGSFKRVLCVCSAGLLRSPTTAVVLSQAPYNFNTRAAGLVPEFALVPVDKVLMMWADEVVCMTSDQKKTLENMARPGLNVICLNIEDSFAYRDPQLMELIRNTYDQESAELLKSKEEKKAPADEQNS